MRTPERSVELRHRRDGTTGGLEAAAAPSSSAGWQASKVCWPGLQRWWCVRKPPAGGQL